jgi:hypothetical protein
VTSAQNYWIKGKRLNCSNYIRGCYDEEEEEEGLDLRRRKWQKVGENCIMRNLNDYYYYYYYYYY